MNATLERWRHEEEFHDQQAAERASRLSNWKQLRFHDADYLDHESWIRPAFEKLGPLDGKTVLDYGCGHGMAAVVLARQGAEVTGFDLSGGYVAEAQCRAMANEVTAQFVQANAESLPFENESFDAVWGSAILHHLDLKQAGQELNRILKPGGIAVFCEPWGGNPLLEFGRRYLPYAGKDRTPDERPLRRGDLEPLREIFPQLEVQGFQLLGMAQRIFRREYRSGHWLERIDGTLLSRQSWLENWCRYVVLTLRKS